MSHLLEEYYASRDTLTRIRQKSSDLRRIVQTALERNNKKYDLQLKQLKDTEKREKYRIYGELLNTYGYELTGGEKSFTCLNYYTNEEITIPLDTQLSAKDNAKKHFDKYNKLKRTYEALTDLTKETKAEIDHLESISAKLMEIGCEVEESDDAVRVVASRPLNHTHVKTLPYPGFPTDMQPQIAVVLSLAQGTSLVTEGVYGANRFKYMDELRRMGGQVQVDGRVAVIEGVEYLTGAPVQACDLRAGAALVIAGLAARGVTELTQVQFIERGYEDIVGKLRALGANIRVVEEPGENEELEAHIG